MRLNPPAEIPESKAKEALPYAAIRSNEAGSRILSGFAVSPGIRHSGSVGHRQLHPVD